LWPLSTAYAASITTRTFGIVTVFEPSIHSDQPCGFRPSEDLVSPEGESCRYCLIVRHSPPTRAGGSIRSTTASCHFSLRCFRHCGFHSPDIVRLFWLAQHCFQCLARCCSPAPPPLCSDCGFRRPGCDKARVSGRNQSRSLYPTAVISSVVPYRSEERQRSTALTPATLQLYDFHRLAAGPFPYRNSRPCLASE
jgi:hypothetical protein